MDEEPGREPVDELDLELTTKTRTRRPRALWAVLAVVGVVAGALVVTSAEDDGDQRPALPIDLSAARDSGVVGEAADASMPAWVTYVPGDDMPTLGGEAPAYRLSSDVDETQVRTLADALGLEGDVVEGPDRTWSVTGEGGVGRLDVHTGGGAFWAYILGVPPECIVEGVVLNLCHDVVSCEVRPDGSQECTGPGTAPLRAACSDAAVDCYEEPTRAADLPAEGDARRVALDLVAATGADIDGATVNAEPGAGSWSVTVEPALDGVPSGLLSSVEVGADLQVVSGSGSLGRPATLGDYPLLDTRATIARANETADRASDVSASGTADIPPTTEPLTGGDDVSDAAVPKLAEPASLDPCRVEPDGREICEVSECATEVAPGPADLDAGGGSTGVQPCPPPCPPPAGAPGSDLPPDAAAPTVCTPPIGDPAPVPEPLEIVLVDAQPSLVQVPATDGSGDAYLVPAYRFDAADGGVVDLPAIADEALSGAVSTETTAPGPAPDPVPLPEPQPCAALEDADAVTGTTDPAPTCPPCPPQEEASSEACASPGEILVIGRPYYVDVDVQCGGGTFALGGQTWITDDPAVAGWADPGERHEGGAFTLDAEGHGTFVGDEAGTLVAEFRTLGPAEGLRCAPQPR
jgi:hypothetical protein